MALSPQEYARFDRCVDAKTIMMVITDRLGRDVADKISAEALAVAEGSQPAPQAIWPRF